jgi:hypothetical protein
MAKRVIAYLLVKVALMLDICANAGTPIKDVVLHYNGKPIKNAGGYLALITARAVLGNEASETACLELAKRLVNLTGVYHSNKDAAKPISGVSEGGLYKGNRQYLDPKHMHAARLDACNVTATKRAYWHSRVAVYQLVARATDLAIYVQAVNERLKADKGHAAVPTGARLTGKALKDAVATWQTANAANDKRAAKEHA